MIIYPSMDLRAGKCVRLYQGDYAKETIYGDSPLSIIKAFLAKGAQALHLVDLDGARNPNLMQTSLIKDCLEALAIPIQVGGGIRREEQIKAYFEAGADKVVIGTLAIESPKTVVSWFRQFGAHRFVLAFDVRLDGEKACVMTQAWQRKSSKDLFEVIRFYIDYDLQHILVTDISRDGALKGPNTALYQDLVQQFKTLNIQASGGIRSIEDLQGLKAIGVGGAIVGRAFYEKELDLSEVLSCLA